MLHSEVGFDSTLVQHLEESFESAESGLLVLCFCVQDRAARLTSVMVGQGTQ